MTCPFRERDHDNAGAARLLAAERTGLRLAVLCRSVALTFLLSWALAVAPSSGTVYAACAIIGLFTVIGFVFYWIIGSPHDRAWMKYLFYLADCIALGVIYVITPLTFESETPQILVTRAFGAYPLLLPLALSTLSLNARLVAWTGASAGLAWMGIYQVLTANMQEVLTWRDLDAQGANYVELFLSVNFIGSSSGIEQALFIFMTALMLTVAVERARRVFKAQIKAESDRALVTKTFSEFVPTQLANKLLEDETALAPQSRVATVMCVDIAGFTALCQQTTPEGVFALLDAFFTDGADVVHQAGGVIVDFSGDGFLAAFNAPLELDSHAAAALSAARALLGRAATTRYAGHNLTIRIGIATGPIAAGSVGGGGKRSYTVHGDTVNLAARLQEAAKRHRVSVALDGDTADAADDPDLHLLRDSEDIRGRDLPIRLYGYNLAA